VGEVVATAVLVLLIFPLARTGRAALAPAAVGAYIGAAYSFTSSTSFANPAVGSGRAFSDTFAGIATVSVPDSSLSRSSAPSPDWPRWSRCIRRPPTWSSRRCPHQTIGEAPVPLRSP
jgi:hypothetical protein